MFQTRAGQPLPGALPSRPRSRERPYTEMPREGGITPDLDAGYKAAAELLNPILSSTVVGRWDHTTSRWR